MSNRRGPGRPNKYSPYVASWGDRIDGAYKGKDGKLRPFGRSRPAFSLSDEARAVHRFKRWLAAQDERPKPEVPVSMAPSLDALDAMIGSSPITAGVISPDAITTDLDTIRRAERDRLRTLILNDPERAAIELDIDFLERYPARPEKPQYSLSELANYYCQNKRDEGGKLTHRKWQQNVRLAWRPTPKEPAKLDDKRKRSQRRNMPKNAFLDVVQVQHVRDIRQHHIKSYRDAILAEFTEYKHSASWIKTRYRAVKAILGFMLEEVEENEKPEYRRVKDLCRILKEPQSETDPNPIEPEHYRPLVEAAKPREKAILLLGLNCLMHSGEATQTLKEDVSLENGTLSARRTKTRKARIAKLWPRTVDAIREYLKLRNDQSEYLFVTQNGTPMSGEVMRQIVVRLRRRLKLPEHVTFEGLRDAGYTIADEVDSERATWIGGHPKGQKDRYILRQANTPRIRKCCEAIETHFFGKRS